MTSSSIRCDRRLAVLVGIAVGVLGACDNAKRADVDGLQQRLDGLASDNAALRKQVEELSVALGKKADLDAAEKRVEEVSAKLVSLGSRLDGIEAKGARPPAARIGSPDPALRYRVTVDDAHADGSSDAKITVVIFSDFQCPFCAKVQATLDDVQKEYGKDVRIVAKHNPLPMHTQAELAARASEAAGAQGKFWEMHDKLYVLGRAIDEASIDAAARELKLDVKQLHADMGSTKVAERIADHKGQAMALGARGTPAFFINGKYLSGAQPLGSFKSVIDVEMAEADRLIAAGTPAGGVYNRLMDGAKERVD